MKKIKSLFERDYEGTRRAYDSVVPGSEWVINGEGVATVKFDGTSCMVSDGILYKRYDRKLTKAGYRRKQNGETPTKGDFKPAPENWIAAESEPNVHTGHWPGWLPVDFSAPENRWHYEAWKIFDCYLPDGTYELVGPKIGGNPHKLTEHDFWKHGSVVFDTDPPRDFYGLEEWFADTYIEGIVWHHPDGRMVKIKRSDFGYNWP